MRQKSCCMMLVLFHFSERSTGRVGVLLKLDGKMRSACVRRWNVLKSKPRCSYVRASQLLKKSVL